MGTWETPLSPAPQHCATQATTVLKHFSSQPGASGSWGNIRPVFIAEEAEAWQCSDITRLSVPGLGWMWMCSLLYSKDFKMGKLGINPTTRSSCVQVLCESLGMCLYNWSRNGPIGLKILFQSIHPSGLPSVKKVTCNSAYLLMASVRNRARMKGFSSTQAVFVLFLTDI